jgi:hypothetical protein
VRNATDQSGLITGTQRVFSVKNVRFDIEKPPNHSDKYLIAMIRPTTVGIVYYLPPM